MNLTRRDFIAMSGALVVTAQASNAATPAAPQLEKLPLFRGGEGGYALYRIPGIVVTKRGSVLAYCEARKFSGGDWGTIDILLRRSTDNGKTWDAPRNIANVEGPKPRNPVALEKKQGKPDDITYNNPVAIIDHKTGAVHFLFCLEYGRCFYQRSDDDGVTFTKPVEITSTFEAFRARYNWRVLATGPAHGIQLRNGQLKNGRLVVPVWLSLGETGNGHGPSVTAVIYSDDHGRTWRAGEIIGLDTPELISPNETVVVQLNDGSTLLNMRSPSKANRRAITTSKDGATGWSKPVFDDELVEPICMASLVRYSTKPSRLLFVNPNNLTRADGKEAPGVGRDRKNVSVWLSSDEGKTWPLVKTLEPGPSGYSDIAVGKDGTILCFYESNSSERANQYNAQLTLARLNLEWLMDGQGAQKK